MADHTQDAAQLQKMLKDRFESDGEDEAKVQTPRIEPSSPKEADKPHPKLGSILSAKRPRQIIKTIFALALIVAAGWAPGHRLFQVSSVEAIINARVITLRTPIDGIVGFQPGTNRVNRKIEADALIARVENQRVNRTQLNDLTRQLDLARVEQDRLIAQRTSLTGRKSRLIAQEQQYRNTRLQALGTRSDEARAEQAEKAARLKLAQQRHTRSTQLLGQKVVSADRFDETRTNVEILKAGLARVNAKIRHIELETKTLESGHHFGDHYNDRTRQAVEIEQTNELLADINVQLNAQTKRIASLTASLERERNNLQTQAFAEITLPVSGKVWETLVASGEQVTRGQPLIRVLDCAHALVTTAVSEEVYNRLTVGTSATFILRESGREFPATVAQLSGVTSAAANLAILPSALEKEPYRATVDVPGLAQGGTCLLGKTGRVVFDSKT